jgi:multidrug transporter EmrE-like cation transporter
VVEPKPFHFTRRQSIALVFFCTVFGAAAQVLIKSGANTLTTNNPLAMLSNPHLLAGYCLYGLNTVLLTLALKDGELSILYPVISLTFIWVTFLSLIFFRESISPPKVLGVLVIVVGVAVLGKGGKA